MSNLRSAVEEFRAVPNSDLSSSQLAADIVEIEEVVQSLRVTQAEKLSKLSDRGGHAELGYPSPTALLIDQGRMSAGHAREIVSRANLVERAVATASAWVDGRLSTDQADRLFQLARDVPDAFPEAEEALIEIVAPLSVKDTDRALEYWRQSVDGPGPLGSDQQELRRGLFASRSLNGMVRVDGWLTTPAGEAFLVLLHAHMPAPTDGDLRSPAQRRHDAFHDIVRDQLDHLPNPVMGGDKPHLTVMADLDALRGIAGGTHETLSGQVVDVESIRQLACDASVTRIVLGPDSEVLDVGRKTRVWTSAQRRAIVARDRHCTAPGCERPPRWCDVHHIDHWADGGLTSVENGRLLCRFHHTQEHARVAAQRESRPT